MRIVFMGTPYFASVVLEYLASQHEVVGVFTRPDAVRSRGRTSLPSPVKEVAHHFDLPVYEYTSFKDNDALEVLRALDPEVICVAAYSALLPQEVLSLPKMGCLNVHASLLPRWRGAAPIERAILAGDRQSGVCIMRMEAGLDTGDYCVARSMDIGSLSADELTAELADLGAAALLSALQHGELGVLDWTPQDGEGVTYAHKLEKGELNVDPSLSAREGRLRIQASGESHPSRAVLADRSVTLLKARETSDSDEILTEDMQPGDLRFSAKRLFIAFSNGVLEILSLKPDGKKPMEARAFAAGIQGIKTQTLTWRGL